MASRQTKVLGGENAQAQSFTLDPGLFQYIESVLVQIDNTAGPDTSPVLTVSTVNGTPIADKQQGSVIPAGDSGRATWALRLDDEQAASSDPFLPVYSVYVAMTGGQVINNNANTPINFTTVHYDNGDWVDLAVSATTLTVPATGYYTVWAQYEWNNPVGAGQRRQATIVLNGDPYIVGEVARENVGTITGVPTSQNVSLTRRLVAGSTLRAFVLQASGGPFTIGSVHYAVTRVWKE